MERDPGLSIRPVTEPERARRAWLRPAGLLILTLALSVSSTGILVGIPFLALAMVFGVRSFNTVAAAILAVMVSLGTVAGGGTWYLERGWTVVLAGWFVVVTMRWPRARFFPRALGAVLATTALVSVLFVVQPGSWATIDWIVTEGVMRSVSLALGVLTGFSPEGAVPAEVVGRVFEAAAGQGRVFPALLGLSSLTGLAVAWWAYVRFAWGSDQGLAPLRDFRFNDDLVWLLVAGLALIVFSLGDGWTRAGTNAVVFMGALYAVRGAAVLLFFKGSVTLLGFLLVLVGMLLFAPVILMGLLVIGVGDTWLDLRAKAAAISGAKTVERMD